MQSLQALVENQGVTVCSVIHQPRKFIFELFDDLILLGVGGRVVYNGAVAEAKDYIECLNYKFPVGDSVADWLIDVSAGQAEPEGDTTESEAADGDTGTEGTKRMERESFLDEDYVHNGGPSSNAVEEEFEQAKVRREHLYTHWESHVGQLSEEEKERFRPPVVPFDLPPVAQRPTFGMQLWVQLRRYAVVARRNRVSKLVETFVIVAAVVLIAIFEGVVVVTQDDIPDLDFEKLVSGVPEDHATQIPLLYGYSVRGFRKLLE